MNIFIKGRLWQVIWWRSSLGFGKRSWPPQETGYTIFDSFNLGPIEVRRFRIKTRTP